MAAGKVLGQLESSTIWSFSRLNIWLRPYDWTYLREFLPEVSFFLSAFYLDFIGFNACLDVVDVPPWFSSVTMIFTSSVGIDKEQLTKVPKSMLPVVGLLRSRLSASSRCFRYLFGFFM